MWRGALVLAALVYLRPLAPFEKVVPVPLSLLSRWVRRCARSLAALNNESLWILVECADVASLHSLEDGAACLELQFGELGEAIRISCLSGGLELVSSGNWGQEDWRSWASPWASSFGITAIFGLSLKLWLALFYFLFGTFFRPRGPGAGGLFIDFYETLEIRPNASDVEIRRDVRRLSLKVHPDLAGAGANPKSILLTRARGTLIDPYTREKYDFRYVMSVQLARWTPVFIEESKGAGIEGVVLYRISGGKCVILTAVKEIIVGNVGSAKIQFSAKSAISYRPMPKLDKNEVEFFPNKGREERQKASGGGRDSSPGPTPRHSSASVGGGQPYPDSWFGWASSSLAWFCAVQFPREEFGALIAVLPLPTRVFRMFKVRDRASSAWKFFWGEFISMAEEWGFGKDARDDLRAQPNDMFNVESFGLLLALLSLRRYILDSRHPDPPARDPQDRPYPDADDCGVIDEPLSGNRQLGKKLEDADKKGKKGGASNGDCVVAADDVPAVEVAGESLGSLPILPGGGDLKSGLEKLRQRLKEHREIVDADRGTGARQEIEKL